VSGVAESTTGVNAGVVGTAMSSQGWGGFFHNEGGGPLLAATEDHEDLNTLEFEVRNDGTLAITGPLALTPMASGPTTCDNSTKGWVYYDSSVDAICFCSDAGGWKTIDGTSDCDP
jgi:hypothetical protein